MTIRLFRCVLNYSQILHHGKIVSCGLLTILLYTFIIICIICIIIVCGLLSDGVLALISDQPLPSAVNDVISAARIPALSTSIITMDTNSTVVSIASSEEQLAGALSSLIKYNQWTDVILLTWQGSGIHALVPYHIKDIMQSCVYLQFIRFRVIHTSYFS